MGFSQTMSPNQFFPSIRSSNVTLSPCTDFRIKGAYVRFQMLFCFFIISFYFASTLEDLNKVLHHSDSGKFGSTSVIVFFYQDALCAKCLSVTGEAHFCPLSCVNQF